MDSKKIGLRYLFALSFTAVLLVTLFEGMNLTPTVGSPLMPPNAFVLPIFIASLVSINLLTVFHYFDERTRTGLDLVLVASSVFFISHLFILNPGIPYSHDLHHHISAVAAIRYHLTQGEVFPRWTHDFWGGMPLFRFEPPLFFMLMVPLMFLEPLQTIKITVILFQLASAIAMYFVVKRLLGNRTHASFAAICYTLSGYHILDLNVRGALMELGSFIWLPLVFYSSYRMDSANKNKDRLKWAILSGILLSISILSHVPTSFFTFVWVSIFWIWQTISVKKARDVIWPRAKAFLLCLTVALGLSAWYLGPAVMERDYVNLGAELRGWFSFAQHFVEPEHLLTRSFGWHSSPKMPLYIGQAQLLVACASIVPVMLQRKQRKINLFLFFTMIGTLVFTSNLLKGVFLELIKTNNPIVGVMTSVVFPWRALQLYSFSSSILAGTTVLSLTEEIGNVLSSPKKQKLGAILAVIILSGIAIDIFPSTGYAGGYVIPKTRSTDMAALKWISNQRGGYFRVYVSQYENFDDYYFAMAQGEVLPILGPAPHGSYRPNSSIRIVDKAINELRHARWLTRASYLSTKYVVTNRKDYHSWEHFVNDGKMKIVQEFEDIIVLENLMVRPFIEIIGSLEDIGAPRINGQVSVMHFGSERIELEVGVDRDIKGFLIVKDSYYPGWTASINGTEVEVISTKEGMLAVPLRRGLQRIVLVFGYTLPELVGKIVSIFTFIAVVILLKVIIPIERKEPRDSLGKSIRILISDLK